MHSLIHSATHTHRHTRTLYYHPPAGTVLLCVPVGWYKFLCAFESVLVGHSLSLPLSLIFWKWLFCSTKAGNTSLSSFSNERWSLRNVSCRGPVKKKFSLLHDLHLLQVGKQVRQKWQHNININPTFALSVWRVCSRSKVKGSRLFYLYP